MCRRISLRLRKISFAVASTSFYARCPVAQLRLAVAFCRLTRCILPFRYIGHSQEWLCYKASRKLKTPDPGLESGDGDTAAVAMAWGLLSNHGWPGRFRLDRHPAVAGFASCGLGWLSGSGKRSEQGHCICSCGAGQTRRGVGETLRSRSLAGPRSGFGSVVDCACGAGTRGDSDESRRIYGLSA